MSTQSEPKGTMGHVKTMASSVHVYTSQRGNDYPRLHLTVDYRDPKHIRLRAHDASGKVVDTLGANDIAEACLLAGMTIRYGETMYARRLRASPKSEASNEPRRSQFDGVRVRVGRLFAGYERARERFTTASQQHDAEGAFFALFEALEWAVALDDFIAECWWPDGHALGFDWRARISGADLMSGLRYARNRVHHQWADALRELGGETDGRRDESAALLWRGSDALPTPTTKRGDAAGRDAYERHLQGRMASETLTTVHHVFARVMGFLDPPRPERV